MRVSINEASDALHISTQTVRRRLAKGLIQGTKQKTAQGYRWLIDIPDNQQNLSRPNGNGDNALLEVLRDQLKEKDRQIGELLLAQTAVSESNTDPLRFLAHPRT